MVKIQKIRKIVFILFLVLSSILYLVGCQKNILFIDEIENETLYPIKNNIFFNACLSIKDNPNLVKDCTPQFIITTGDNSVTAMSFSGDGINWSEWVDFEEKYDKFNIASGLNGTTMDSGTKTIYVRFRNIEGVIFPLFSQDPISCSFNYEMQNLFSIMIEPEFIEMNPEESQTFIVRGFDLFSENEVPLDGNKVEWSKPCAAGKLSNTTGLKTIYQAPLETGIRNISVHYGALGAGARVFVKSGQNINIIF